MPPIFFSNFKKKCESIKASHMRKSHMRQKWPTQFKAVICTDKLYSPVLSIIPCISSSTALRKTALVLCKTLDTYEAKEIFLSFNGGKDCTVLLHMFVNLFNKRYPNEKMICLYIQPDNPFDEIENFIRECEQLYMVKVERIRGTVKATLFEICQKYPHLKAVVMGCRRTDPYCSDLNVFQKTDMGWPQLMRVNPLLEWTCKDIWDYLHKQNVPYCSLYKLGYTSIGDRTNTLPNPYLKRISSVTGEDEYLHADQLIDGDEHERAGRL